MTIHNLKAILDSGGTIVRGKDTIRKDWFFKDLFITTTHGGKTFHPDWLDGFVGNPSEWSELTQTTKSGSSVQGE